MAVDIFIPSQILTFADFASFPASGTVKTLYIAEDTKYQYYWDGTQYVQLTAEFEIPANLIFYSTTAASDVAGYTKLVISIDDPDYDDPAVDVPTGTINTTAQLLAELVADAGIFAGNPGVINISTIGEIRRTSGSGTAEFYFEVYQRDSLGVETLRGTSNKTAAISGSVYQQFQADCLFNNGTWLATDRVVIKYYADRVGSGSNPNYDFLFGGTNPVRTLFPISAQLLLNVPIAIGITGVTGGVANEVLLTDGSGKLGQSELKTVGGQSLFGSGDITVGGGITIGTTAIASGNDNRVLFQAGGVVQQNANFQWINADNRAVLGTEAVADTNSRLVVIGKGTGTNTTFAVHNSTGTNNALVVRDDGRISFNSLPTPGFLGDYKFRGLGGTADLYFNNSSANVFEIRSSQWTGTFDLFRSLVFNGQNIRLFTENAIGFTLERFGSLGQRRVLLHTPITNNNGTVNSLVIRNEGSGLDGTMGIVFQRSSEVIYGYLRATLQGSGTNNYITIGAQNAAQTSLNEVIRFIGNGNVLIGTTTDSTTATKTLVINNGTSPTGNVTDSFQQYSADIAAGNAAPHFRTENGDIVKIYRVGGWGLPTGAFTRTTFDTTTVTLQELAERVAALIQDLRDNHQLLKA